MRTICDAIVIRIINTIHPHINPTLFVLEFVSSRRLLEQDDIIVVVAFMTLVLACILYPCTGSWPTTSSTMIRIVHAMIKVSLLGEWTYLPP